MKIGKFEIISSFKVPGRGLVAMGNIVEGIVMAGAYTVIRVDSINNTLQIAGVEAIDKVSAKETWVGLLFSYNSGDELKKLENVKLEKQVIDIYDQV